MHVVSAIKYVERAQFCCRTYLRKSVHHGYALTRMISNIGELRYTCKLITAKVVSFIYAAPVWKKGPHVSCNTHRLSAVYRRTNGCILLSGSSQMMRIGYLRNLGRRNGEHIQHQVHLSFIVCEKVKKGERERSKSDTYKRGTWVDSCHRGVAAEKAMGDQ